MEEKQPDLGGLLIEALREIKELRIMVEDVHLLFKPRPSVKRLTKKQQFDIDVRKGRIEETARLLAKA